MSIANRERPHDACVPFPAPSMAVREGNLDEIGAVLCAIRALTTGSGGIDEEDTRAVYSLACIGLTEWRLLDGAVGQAPIGGKR